jgi:TPR repeat protein
MAGLGPTKKQQSNPFFVKARLSEKEGNYELAAHQYREAAQLGNVTAMNELANLLGEHPEISAHAEEEIELYQLSSELGHGKATFNVGWS